MNAPGQNTGVGSLFLLQGIFPTQGLNPGLPLCRWILYQLNHKGSPRILKWVAYPFSSGSSWPRNRTGDLLHCRQILTNWAINRIVWCAFLVRNAEITAVLTMKVEDSLKYFTSGQRQVTIFFRIESQSHWELFVHLDCVKLKLSEAKKKKKNRHAIGDW